MRPDDAIGPRLRRQRQPDRTQPRRRQPRPARTRPLDLPGRPRGHDRPKSASDAGTPTGYVQYGRSLAHVDSTVDRLWLFIAAGVFGGTLLASLAGLAIAGRAMRPVSSLTASAREIAETGDPSRHMPEPKIDDEVGELARTLEQMLRSLDAARAEREAAMKKQREFVADASHELRTPLTSILANLELLQASLNEPGQDDEQAMIDSALRSSQRMTRLVADLLLLARADAGKRGAHRRCDLAEIAGDAAVEAAPLMGDRELAVENERALLARRATPTSCTGWSSTCSTTPPATRRRPRRSSCACGPRTARPSSRSPTTARASPPSCASRSSTASSAATGPPTPPPGPAAASAWRSSAPSPPPTAAGRGGGVGPRRGALFRVRLPLSSVASRSRRWL